MAQLIVAFRNFCQHAYSLTLNCSLYGLHNREGRQHRCKESNMAEPNEVYAGPY
jgi:hypothetical protein